MNREVQWWVDRHGAQRLLVVATGVVLVWDERARDWSRPTLVPPALRGAFVSEPCWIDLTRLPRQHRVPVIPAERLAAVAAPIRGVAMDTLVGDLRAMRRRAKRLVQMAFAILLALSVSLAVVAVVAVRSRQQAFSELGAVVSDQLISKSESIGDANPAMSRLLGVAAWRIDPSSAARYAMLTAAALPATAILPGPHGNPVTGIAFSSDGSKLVGATSFHVWLWDVTTHRLLRNPFPLNTYGLGSVMVSPGGQVLAGVNNQDGRVRLWDISSDRRIGTIGPESPHFSPVLAFSPNGRIMAVGGYSSIRLWDVATAQPIGAPMQSNYPENIAFTSDGRTLAVANAAGTVQLWDIANQQRIGKPMQVNVTQIRAISFSPDGALLAVVSNLGGLTLWDIATGQQASPLAGSTGQVSAAAFNPDGQMLVTVDQDGTIRLWNVAARQEIGNPMDGGTGPVSSMTFSPDGRSLATGGNDGKVRLWDLARLVGMIALATPEDIPPSRVGGLAFSPDGTILASATTNDAMSWHMPNGQPVGSPLIPASGAAERGTVAFSPDGRIIATAIRNNIQMSDAATGQLLGWIRPHVANGLALSTPLAFSADGKILAVGSNVGVVWLFNVASHAKIATIHVTGDLDWGIDGVAFSSDGRFFAATSPLGTLLWNTAGWKPAGRVSGMSGSDFSLAFSPDGTLLAVAGGYEVRVLDVATRRQIGDPFINTSNSDQDEFTSAAFSSDSQTLAVGTTSGTVQLYMVSTGQEIGESLPVSSSQGISVTAVALDQSGRFLAAGANDGSIRIWNVSYLVDVPARLCAAAGQTLTPAEWAGYVHGLAYENICP